MSSASSEERAGTADLLPGPDPVCCVDETGRWASQAQAEAPPAGVLSELYRHMVLGRRFDQQATALVRQGRLAVYPSSYGQEACQVGPVLALQENDWMFPTYRESVALLTRGVDAIEVLTLMRGNWHCGYDPYAHRCAPQCTPLATSALHGVGLADAARRKGEGVAVLVFIGDGATSEGDAHEAFNFAAVFAAPVVFVVQNNQWAISVPLSRQTKAATLAHKAVGYGIRSFHVDGNDAAAMYATVSSALADARAGHGPAIVEGLTYRLNAHINADEATRYRTGEEVETWRLRDPLTRLEHLLRAEGVLQSAAVAEIGAEAERLAGGLRERMSADPALDPRHLFDHVYAEPTAGLREEARRLAGFPAAGRA